MTIVALVDIVRRPEWQWKLAGPGRRSSGSSWSFWSTSWRSRRSSIGSISATNSKELQGGDSERHVRPGPHDVRRMGKLLHSHPRPLSGDGARRLVSRRNRPRPIADGGTVPDGRNTSRRQPTPRRPRPLSGAARAAPNALSRDRGDIGGPIVFVAWPSDKDRIAGTVRWFDGEEGWGVIDRPRGAGRMFLVLFSDIVGVGYRSLEGRPGMSRLPSRSRDPNEDVGTTSVHCRYGLTSRIPSRRGRFLAAPSTQMRRLKEWSHSSAF